YWCADQHRRTARAGTGPHRTVAGARAGGGEHQRHDCCAGRGPCRTTAGTAPLAPLAVERSVTRPPALPGRPAAPQAPGNGAAGRQWQLLADAKTEMAVQAEIVRVAGFQIGR